MSKKTSYDPEKVHELRTKVIMSALEVLNGDEAVDKWSAYKKELVLKMSSRVLPVLNEISGREGEQLVVSVISEIADKNGIGNTSTINNSKGQT